MEQKDYVSRKYSTVIRKKKIGYKKNNKSNVVNLIMITAAILFMILFINKLWFVSSYQKKNMSASLNNKINDSILPPKPEERWKYIKELENNQIKMPLLKNYIINNNDKTKSRILLPNKDDKNQTVFINRKSKTQTPNLQNKLNNNIHTHSEQNNLQHWIIQCGVFKEGILAESIHAHLAFQGFESHINSKDGWNSVVIGPFKDRNSAYSIVNRLHIFGYKNCIPSISGG
ncbi:SPOR domain-containing protein [Pantoea sp. Aalb]|uniref:SPOR domain-containing protein n=1 Tax=Pantoea sp. Aalb TaxID=2576762 RepID=UPI001323E8EC|nr:SPOR domain-containing protein [Pantoea sp. Aalb]MXP67925.1 hypothetical protein [Pantoea sp. Aalb]